MSEPIVRIYEDRDVAALADLITELGSSTSAEDMSQRMAAIKQRDDFATFVAEEGGEVVGMVGVCLRPGYVRDVPSGHVIALVVAERARRRGVGVLLMARAEAWLAKNGAGLAFLVSAYHRSEAHAFYDRLGYEDTGRRFTKRIRSAD